MNLPPFISGKNLLTAICLGALVSLESLHGNGMRLVSQDAFAAARGEAFVATADNPSAIYYNPAGLTQLEGHQLRASVYGLYFEPTFQSPTGGKTFHIDKKHAVVPQLFYSYTMEDRPLSFGLGLYSPHGAAVEWPEDTGFRSVAIEGELTYLRLNPVIAYKLTPCFSISGGIMLDYGDLSFEQGLSSNTRRPNFFRFEGDDLSVAYNLGALWQPNEKISIGATVRSGTSLNFDGDTEIDPVFGPFETSPATLEYNFPLTAVLGISYRPTPAWNWEFNIDFTEWSDFDQTVIKQEIDPRATVQNIDVDFDWKNSFIYKFGVTRYFDNGWHGSLGYVFSENSVRDTFYTPLVADLDRHFVSVGIGKKTERFEFDAAYQFGFAPSNSVKDSTPSLAGLVSGQNADGTYDFTSHALVLSFGMKF